MELKMDKINFKKSFDLNKKSFFTFFYCFVGGGGHSPQITTSFLIFKVMMLLYQSFVFWVLCAHRQWYQYALAGSLLSLNFTHTSNQGFTTDPASKFLASLQYGLGHGTVGWYTKELAETAMSNVSPSSPENRVDSL